MMQHPQIQRSLLTVIYPSLGAIIANLPEIKGWLEVLSLALGCLGSIAMFCSVIKHWNDKKSDTSVE